MARGRRRDSRTGRPVPLRATAAPQASAAAGAWNTQPGTGGGSSAWVTGGRGDRLRGSRNAALRLDRRMPSDTALAAWNAILEVLEMAVGAAECTLKDRSARCPQHPSPRWRPSPRSAGSRRCLGPLRPRAPAIALSAAQERVAKRLEGPAGRREATAGGRLRSRRRGPLRCRLPGCERIAVLRKGRHSPQTHPVKGR